MNRKGIRAFIVMLGAFVLIGLVIYASYLLGDYLIHNRLVNYLFFEYVIPYVFPTLVGLLFIIAVIIIAVTIIALFDEATEGK